MKGTCRECRNENNTLGSIKCADCMAGINNYEHKETYIEERDRVLRERLLFNAFSDEDE